MTLSGSDAETAGIFLIKINAQNIVTAGNMGLRLELPVRLCWRLQLRICCCLQEKAHPAVLHWTIRCVYLIGFRAAWLWMISEKGSFVWENR